MSFMGFLKGAGCVALGVGATVAADKSGLTKYTKGKLFGGKDEKKSDDSKSDDKAESKEEKSSLDE